MKLTLSMEGPQKDFKASQLRFMTCEQDCLTRPDGSVIFNQGDTSVLAAVYGPGEVKVNKEQIDKATVEVLYKPKVGMPGCQEKQLEQVIKNMCETVILTALHPRTSISVIVQELHHAGSLLSCCINAACMALLDAAVPLNYTVAAVDCVLSDGQIILDPTHKQCVSAEASFTFVFDSKDYHVITTIAKGTYTNAQYQQCLLTAKQASKDIVSFYRDAMKKKLSKIA